MKDLLLVVSLLVSGVVCESPAAAPYAPSGWRPSGPSFELPDRTPVDPRNRPQKQEYLPPQQIPNQSYGPPEEDVSVQGLPTQEQLPIFQLSPVNGQQYVGPTFNADLKSLEQRQREAQAQQNIYREFARQRQLEAAALANANRQPNQPIPHQFIPRTSTTTAKPDDFNTTSLQAETTTETLDLNQGEVVDDSSNKDKVSVEVAKQNVQEYPPELFLTPIAQIKLQNQYAPLQLGQIRAPIYLEPAQRQVAYDSGSLSVVPLAQQQYVPQQQYNQQPLIPVQIQPQTQTDTQNPTYLIPQTQYQPNRYQPGTQYEPVQPVQPVQTIQPGQIPQQPTFLQPQPNQLLPRPQEQPVGEQEQSQPQQPQLVYQYQLEYQQPNQYQFQYQQPLNSYQQELFQPQLNAYQQQLVQQQVAQQQQLLQQQILQQQIIAQQQAGQGQEGLQSGFDVNQRGNGIDQENKENEGEDDGTSASAIATAFGTRTQPRPAYGAPVPRVQANPGYQTSTESANESEDGPAVAEATVVARGDRRKSKLRSRQGRVRPIFTLDKSGHLILAQEQ